MKTQQKKKVRSCSRDMAAIDKMITLRGSKQICIPMTQSIFKKIWNKPLDVRHFVNSLIKTMPEVLPHNIKNGYQLTGRLPESKKMPGIRLRQLRLSDGSVYSLRPSFVMSYMTGTVENIENPLLLLSYGVPHWLVTKCYGHNDMYWYRLTSRFGRNSIVGTTVRVPKQLPLHISADEHHTDWCGEKGYVAFTTGGGCILGAALSSSANEKYLTKAYGKFASEVNEIDSNNTIETANSDGWPATTKALCNLFPSISIVLCFLHGFLKIRKHGSKLHDLHERVWYVYRATTSSEFYKRMQELRIWCEQQNLPKTVMEATAKLWNRATKYAISYDHPGCHRTSNMVDRLMNRLTRLLYAGRGLHGHQHYSELRLRGWALLQNFRPYAPRSGKIQEYQSPAHRLNQKQYHEHWLHNLQVCASMAGRRGST